MGRSAKVVEVLVHTDDRYTMMEVTRLLPKIYGELGWAVIIYGTLSLNANLHVIHEVPRHQALVMPGMWMLIDGCSSMAKVALGLQSH